MSTSASPRLTLVFWQFPMLSSHAVNIEYRVLFTFFVGQLFCLVLNSSRHSFVTRLQNINGGDWKYTLFVVFVSYSQNIRRHNAICRDEFVADVIWIGLKLQFSSWFSIHLILHKLYIFYYQINSIYKCIIIESNVLHWSVSYWENIYCKIFLYSLCKYQWIETQLWKVILHPLHCDIEFFDCDRWKSQLMYISNLAS